MSSHYIIKNLEMDTIGEPYLRQYITQQKVKLQKYKNIQQLIRIRQSFIMIKCINISKINTCIQISKGYKWVSYNNKGWIMKLCHKSPVNFSHTLFQRKLKPNSSHLNIFERFDGVTYPKVFILLCGTLWLLFSDWWKPPNLQTFCSPSQSECRCWSHPSLTILICNIHQIRSVNCLWVSLTNESITNVFWDHNENKLSLEATAGAAGYGWKPVVVSDPQYFTTHSCPIRGTRITGPRNIHVN